jgi:hypothetical protein
VKEIQKRRAQRALKGSSGKTFFSKFTYQVQSYAAALHEDTQHQQTQAPQTDEKSVQHPTKQHLPQQKIKKKNRSVSTAS